MVYQILNMEHLNSLLDEKIKQLSALSEIGKRINAVHDLNNLLNLILSSAIRELKAQKGSIFLLEKGSNELKIKFSKGISKKAIIKNKFKIGQGIAGLVAKEKKPTLVSNTLNNPHFIFKGKNQKPTSLLCVPLLSKENFLGVISIESSNSKKIFAQKDLAFLIILASQASIAIENAQLFESINKTYFDTISALANAIEAKDPYTLGHSNRVTQYAISIAEDFSLPKNDIQTLQYASILHDVGKIGVRGAVLNKADKLSEKEFDEIKKHSIIGENIIKNVDFLREVGVIIRHHQECYNGTGYPDGLKKDKIPFLSAIIAVADVYDALVTDRPYRKAHTHEKAIEILKEETGKKLHPQIVKVFLRIFG